MRRDLAGGPRHDLLTYPRWFARWVLGAEPDEEAEVVTPAPALLSPSGVEGQIAVAQRWSGGAVATLLATVLTDTPTTATVVGADATLALDGEFYQPGSFTLTSARGETLRYDGTPDRPRGLVFRGRRHGPGHGRRLSEHDPA